jgi:hypothetical protein
MGKHEKRAGCDPAAGAQEAGANISASQPQTPLPSPPTCRSPAQNLAGLGPVVRQAAEGRTALVAAPL